MLTRADSQWEAAWAAYDETTYQVALGFIRPDDVVLDIGAGDLRFACRAAARARAVVAIEQRPTLLLNAARLDNLTVICGDALRVPFPEGITAGVLLMRHCRHFAEYTAKLRAIGCTRLITNARWRMGVEEVSLVPQPPFTTARLGWYACLCGAVGFKPGPADEVTPAMLEITTQVEICPACAGAKN